MKTRATLAAAVLAATAAFVLQASAAEAQPGPAGAQQAEQPAQPKADQKDQAGNCPCLEEKAGAAVHMHGMHANQSASAKVNPMFDRSKHYHPRDGGKL